MACTLDRFDDFHLHGASAPEWNQRYLQISPGAMRSTLTEATAGRVHVFRKWMSERVVQQGCLPAGKVCFALLDEAVAGGPRAQGQELHEDKLFVLRAGEDFTLQRPPGMALLAVTFEAEDFRRLLDQRPWDAASSALLRRPLLRAPIGALQRLRVALRRALAVPGEMPVGLAAFHLLGELFAEAALAPQTRASASASYVVAQCERLAAAQAHEPPDIDALCRRLRASRRHVQTSFRLVADTTPLHYLRSLRLNAVRRRLMSTSAAQLSVAQAATDEGFSHLSHFAQRYRALFGELPSATMRRG